MCQPRERQDYKQPAGCGYKTVPRFCLIAWFIFAVNQKSGRRVSNSKIVRISVVYNV